MSNDLGQTLRTRRRELGLTQREVAARVGVCRAVVSKWERGESQPPPDHLEVLAWILQLRDEILQARRSAPTTRQESRPDILRRRRRVRPLYPHSATLEQMLRVGGWAPRVHEAALRRLGDEGCAEVVACFPRDTPHELLVAFHASSHGARLIESAPDSQGCPLFVLDDFEKRPGGDQRQPALFLRGTDDWMLLYGQVRVLGTGRRPYRVDFLVHYKKRKRRGVWVTVEIDGEPHALTPNQDAARAEGLGVPEIRFDNEQTRYSDFFDRLVREVRKSATVAARWDREHRKEARLRRREREQQAAQRCAR